MKIIAEVKTQSPFGFKSQYSFDTLLNKAEKIGDMVSIHTDQRWGGSLEILKKVCKTSEKFVLAKGIHSTDKEIYEARDAGAHRILVVGRLPHYSLIDWCFLEPLNLEQLIEWASLGVSIVWNRRNLLTGEKKDISLEIVYSIMRNYPNTKLIIASLIKNRQSIPAPTPWGIIVGENLMNFK